MAAKITIHYTAVVQSRWVQAMKVFGKIYRTCDCKRGHGSPGEATGCRTSQHNSSRILRARDDGDRYLRTFLKTYEIERVEDG